MKSRSYDLSVSVSWRHVMSVIRSYCISSYHDFSFDYSYFLPLFESGDYFRAFQYIPDLLSHCERTFHYFFLYDSIRRFLRYRPVTPASLGIELAFDFYSHFGPVREV